MEFLIIIPVAFVLANAWVVWSSRTRRAPEIEQTIQAHQRFTEAMTREPRGRGRRPATRVRRRV